ncbi:DUF1080 domain-containing protein [Candidatus Poribacteria bacterium]|nr:DUF1080 domain-containing protein [Candidatus Poribacteria bacterium]
MKLKSSILITVLLIAFSTTVSFAGDQLWTFDSHADSWEVSNGTWGLNDGAYQLTLGAQAEHSLVGDTGWKNYTVESKVRLDEGNWAGIVVRAKSEMEYLVYYLNVPNNKTEFWRHKTGGWTARDKVGELAGKNIKIENGKWFEMKVTVDGDTFSLTIDGEFQGELKDSVYSAGQAGVWGWQTAASFDDFKVSGDDIEGHGVPVEPQDKATTTWGNIKGRH